MTVIKIYPVAHSSNPKTGDIPQTYTSGNTCPERCPFKHNGCYAEGFHTRMAWARAEKSGMSAAALADWVEEHTCENQMIRHNVAGDIATPGTSDIDVDLLTGLVFAFAGRRAYTYTHCEPSAKNLRAASIACAAGFVVNQSCERLDQVDAAMRAGVPAVLAVVADLPAGGIRTPEGRRVIQCPAQTREGVTCKTCRLCARADRPTAIAFAAHGSSAKKARAAIEQANL